MKLGTIVLLVTAFAFLSCTNDNSTEKKVEIKEAKRIENDGVLIDYLDSGTGATSIVFVHGWNINKEYWQPQIQYFSKKYRVVSIDLPGFGKSGKNRKEWTVENYGKDISKVISELDLENVILVGHSMSGAIVLETALTNPAIVTGVVGVDNFTNFGMAMTPELKKDIEEAYKKLKSNYTQVIRQFLNESLFSPSTDSTVRKRVSQDFLTVDSSLVTQILETNEKYPVDAKLKSLGQTLYLINSDHHPTDTSNFRKQNVPFELLNIGPTGHYPMIEKPQDFNKLLEQVIRKLQE